MALRLTPREDGFYQLFADLAAHTVDGAHTLARMLEASTQEDRSAVAKALREREHLADESTHAIITKVNASFITPFDREDIHTLASCLDDCMDHIEAAGDLIDLYRVESLPTGCAEQMHLLARMAEATAAAMPRLRSMHEMPEYWIEINRLENQADKLYRRLLAELFNGTRKAMEVMKLKDIITELESAADAFERVANAVEGIAVKES